MAAGCWTFAEHSPWYFERGVETHREYCDEQICEGEWDEEVVVDVSEFPVEDDADDDQTVVDDCEEDDAEQNNAFHHQQEDIWRKEQWLHINSHGKDVESGMRKQTFDFWFVQNWRKRKKEKTKWPTSSALKILALSRLSWRQGGGWAVLLIF